MANAILFVAFLFAALAAAIFFRGRRRWVGGSVAVLVTGLAALSSDAALKARDAARTAADPASACIQVPDGEGGYRPAADLLDLSPIDMWSNGGRFHGVLVVGSEGDRRLFNWSYRQAAWSAIAPDMEQRLAIRCVPRPGYLGRLGWLTGLSDLGQADAYFRLGRSAYLIPTSFQPKTQNGTYLQLDAPAPDFVPDAVDPAGFQFRTVDLEFRTRDWLESVASSERSASNLDETAPTSDNHPKSFVERDPAGRVMTLISCWAPQSARNPAPCQHRFYVDGAMWSFRQSMDDLPRWRELQQRLQARLGGFAAAGGKCEADADAC